MGHDAAVYRWRYLTESGDEIGVSANFADQEAAESWMGQAWSDLREWGVEQVVLMNETESRKVYEMALSEEPA